MARTIDSMVDEQVRRWHLREEERRREELAKPKPLVVLSREFGTQGAEIGQAVAEELGFELWDQELVHEIAEKSGAPEKLVASLDERSRSALEDLIAASLSGEKSTRFEYVAQLRRVIHTIERHGAAVVIGRGAQFIVEPESALRVRIIAPLDERVKSYAARKEMSREAARKRILEVDHDRKLFMKQSYGKDLGDPSHYDLVLNRAGFSNEAAAAIVVAAYRAKFPASAQ
jgi:cytidylate kinase